MGSALDLSARQQGVDIGGRVGPTLILELRSPNVKGASHFPFPIIEDTPEILELRTFDGELESVVRALVLYYLRVLKDQGRRLIFHFLEGVYEIKDGTVIDLGGGSSDILERATQVVASILEQ